jgi:hypothetical protein
VLARHAINEAMMLHREDRKNIVGSLLLLIQNLLVFILSVIRKTLLW